MRPLAVVLAAVLLAMAHAHAAPAAGGFSEPRAVGAGPVAATAIAAAPTAALGAGGDGAIAWAGGARVQVARRAPAGTWAAQALSRRADEVADLQLVVTPAGTTVVAWTESRAARRRLRDGFFVAIAQRGRRFGTPQTIASGPRADAALARMALLGDGRVVLLWRTARSPRGGELKLAFLGSDGRFGRSRGIGADGVAPAIVATSGGGAMVAWATPAGLHESHNLRAALLPARGRRLGRSSQFSPSAVAGARLAAGPGDAVIASWASKDRPVGLFSRQLAPRRGPTVVVRSGTRAANGPPIALGPGGLALATFVAPRRALPLPAGSPGASQWVVAGTVAGGFGSRVELAGPAAASVVGPASPTILPSGEALVVWSQGRPDPRGGPIDVMVARRPAGATTFAGIERVHGVRRPTSMPVALARSESRVLIAWPASTASGGMLVAER